MKLPAFLTLFGAKAASEAETADQVLARAEALAAAFGEGSAEAKAAMLAGHGVPEAVAAMRQAHAAALAEAFARAEALAAECDALKAELAKRDSAPHAGAPPVPPAPAASNKPASVREMLQAQVDNLKSHKE